MLDVATTPRRVLVAARELDADLRATTSLALLSVVHDLRGWADALVGDRFVSRVGADRLPHLVRYLRAARHRLAKAAENLGRDEGLAWQVHELAEEYDAAVAAAAPAPRTPSATRAWTRSAGCSRSCASRCSPSTWAPRSRCPPSGSAPRWPSDPAAPRAHAATRADD